MPVHDKFENCHEQRSVTSVTVMSLHIFAPDVILPQLAVLNVMISAVAPMHHVTIINDG
jgi:hypothetical protein